MSPAIGLGIETEGDIMKRVWRRHTLDVEGVGENIVPRTGQIDQTGAVALECSCANRAGYVERRAGGIGGIDTHATSGADEELVAAAGREIRALRVSPDKRPVVIRPSAIARREARNTRRGVGGAARNRRIIAGYGIDHA